MTPPGVGRPNGLKSKDPLEQFLNNIEANGGSTAGGNLQSDTSKKLIGEIREAQAFVGGFVEGVKENAHLGKLAVHAATHLSGPVGWVAKAISVAWGLLDGEPILPGGRALRPSYTLNASRPHGNTAGSQPAVLYAKYDKHGRFEKWGVTQDLRSRYSKRELDDGRLVPLASGPRRLMLLYERFLVRTRPGPLNREPWAGRGRGCP